MKLYLILGLFMSTFISCNNYRESNEILTESVYILTKGNLEYFKKEHPNNYSITPWYRKLFILDSIVNMEKHNKSISINTLNKINRLVTKKMIKSRIFDNYKQDSVFIYSCRTYNDLLKLEYIVGNVIIKNYNYFLYRAPAGKITIEKDDTRSVSNVYLSIYDYHNNNYVVINNDTIYSKDGILSIDLKKYKNDTLEVKGSYFYYKPEYREYTSMEFIL